MKKIILFILALFLFTLIALFILKKDSVDLTPKTETKVGSSSKFRFGLIPGLGGFGDKSFNDMQYNGVIKAEKKFKVPFFIREPRDRTDFNRYAKELVEDDSCNVIFVGSYEWQDELDKFAPKHKDVKFILLDCDLINPYPNVASIQFKQNEGSYLTGILAALMNESGSLGVVGAMRIKSIEDFIVGFTAGVAKVDPKIDVVVKYLTEEFDGINPWESPDYANQLSLDMIDRSNVDIIFGVAAASNMGIFKACSNRDIFAIGVDADQDYLAQGTILTSMMKNLDKSILFMTELIINDQFESRNYTLGLKEGGVGLTKMKFTKRIVGKENLKQIEEIEEQILIGEIVVPSVR